MAPPKKVTASVSQALSGFAQFIKQQNVVGLAVGLVLGSSVKGVVDALVADIFNPLLGVLLGGVDLTSKAVCLHVINGSCRNALMWGHFATVVIQFILVAAVVYFVINNTIRLFDAKTK